MLLPLTICALFLPVQPSEPPVSEATPSAPAAPWSQWRGAYRDGRATGTPWGPDLSPIHLDECWRMKDLGPSYSGPVLDEDRVYTTETVDEEFEVVRALDRETGEELWRTSWEGAMQVPFFAARNGSWIRSTPAVDDRFLFVAGMRDYLVCLDKFTGDEIWVVDFVERLGTDLPPFGGVCSPLLDEEHVYIQAGTSLVKLRKDTGETVWRSMAEDESIMNAGSFSSPIFAEFHGTPQIVVQSRSELGGLDRASGEVLWSIPVKAYRGMNILTPTVFEGGVFTTAYGGRSHYFDIALGEEGSRVEPTWEGRVQGYMTSPVVVDGHAYLFTKSNRFTCIDLETGESPWTSPPTGDSYWSLAVQGQRILALSNQGTLRLLEANTEGYRVLSEREITESESWAHLAPSEDQIFIRSQDELIALRWNRDR